MGHSEHFVGQGNSTVCPSCGGRNVDEQWKTDDFQYGDGEKAVSLAVRVPVCHCLDCELQFTDSRSEQLRHARVCKHLGILDPEEVRAIRERYRMSQQEFAQISGVGRASLNRWETGALTQNASSDNLLYLLAFPDNLGRLESRTREGDITCKPRSTSAAGRFVCIDEEEVVGMRVEAMAFELYCCQ